MQNWYSVSGYEGLYEINRNGQIRSLQKKYYQKQITQRIDRGGYITVRLSKEGISKTFLLHRLLILEFIPNPNNKPFVNHINGNKLDNSLENLEWVTHRENVIHAFTSGLNKSSQIKSFALFDHCTKKYYPSIKEAAICLNIPYSSLKNMINTNRRNKTCLEKINFQQTDSQES